MPDTTPAAETSSGTGPADTTGSQGDAAYAEYVTDITNKVTENVAKSVMSAIGLKDGQSLPDMITGAARRTTFEALGVPKDVDPQTHMVNMFKTAAQDLLKVAAPQETTTATNGKNVELDAVRAELETVKTIANDLTTERNAERERATTEHRNGLIRDALSKHKIRTNAVDLVRSNFVNGSLGVNPTPGEDGVLMVDGGNGARQPFANYLDGYFDDNRYLLESHTASGTGATGRNSGTGVQTPDVDGFTDRANKKQLVSAYEADAKATLEAVQKANAENRKSIYQGR